jgi:adenylate cyclase
MQLRIGINIGDVIFDEDDICGDGINVASRATNLCFVMPAKPVLA